MRIRVIDAADGRPNNLGLGAAFLRWAIKAHGGIIAEVGEVADCSLCTLTSMEQLPALRRIRKRYSEPIIAGGPAAWSPAALAEEVDGVCVGEGLGLVRSLIAAGVEDALRLPQVFRNGESRVVWPDTDFPWHMSPVICADGFTRVWLSRGCKAACMFCNEGWARPYARCLSDRAALGQARRLEETGHKVLFTTNDGGDIPTDWNIRQAHFSARYVTARRRLADWNARAAIPHLRVGVEGISESLRNAVGKSVPWDGLFDLTIQVLSAGRKVRWFFVVGLPGETEDDWAEFGQAMRTWKRLCTRGLLMVNMHAYIPQPSTPLACLPLEDAYWPNWQRFYARFSRGDLFSNHVCFTKPALPATRLRRAMDTMACTTEQLRSGWLEAMNANWRVQYNAAPERLRQLAQKYLGKARPSVPLKCQVRAGE